MEMIMVVGDGKLAKTGLTSIREYANARYAQMHPISLSDNFLRGMNSSWMYVLLRFYHFALLDFWPLCSSLSHHVNTFIT